MDFYTNIAPYYDLVFPYQPVQFEFLKMKLDSEKFPRLLDVGCGTGELDLYLAKKGYEVTGIDLKSEMIKRANMTRLKEYFSQNDFDACFCFGNTLVHLSSKDQIKRFLIDLKSIVRSGGKVFFQLINYDRILLEHIKELPTIENDKIKFERFYEFDPEDYRISFLTKLHLKEEKNKLLEHTVKLIPLKRIEMEKRLLKAGYTDIHFYGSFEQDDFAVTSYHLIVEATIL